MDTQDIQNFAKQLVDDKKALDTLRNGLTDAHISSVTLLTRRTQDLGSPTTKFLQDLNLLEKGEDKKVKLTETPFDKQAVTAGATFVTKLATGALSLTGLGTGIYTFYEGFPAVGTERLVLWACATVLLAVVGLAIALIVRADLTARSTATAAQYAARAQVVSAYLLANTYQPFPDQ